MRRDKKMVTLMLGTLVTMGFAAVTVQAQYLNTFDTSSSFVTGSANRTYNPPPMWFGFDYGTPTATATASVSWASGPTYDAGGSAASGSAKLSWTFNTTVDGAGSAAFTADIFSSAQNYSGGTLSFDIMVDPSSTLDAYGGYGYFQVFTRDQDYDDNATSFAEELGNPNYSSPASPGAGVWQYVSIALGSGADSSIRAITFQDYTDAGRDINGSEVIYIDNLELTPAPVPEPSSIALVGLGIVGLFFVRRYRTSMD
jgi:PEP-CTERM motif-containing protein